MFQLSSSRSYLAFRSFPRIGRRAYCASMTNTDVNDPKYQQELRKRLSDQEYQVIVNKGTERAFTGSLYTNKKDGVYTCKSCDAPLFSSDSKYDSGSGWPSFDAAVAAKAIRYETDSTHGMVRTEIMCGKCNGHLGHVFNDGPTTTGKRYCVNSASLAFKEG